MGMEIGVTLPHMTVPKKKPVAKRKPVGSSAKKKPDDDKKALKYVRGGAICDPKEKGAKLIRGSGKAAVCRPTAGKDTRPRYRTAGS
jgi:hypothetical protein